VASPLGVSAERAKWQIGTNQQRVIGGDARQQEKGSSAGGSDLQEPTRRVLGQNVKESCDLRADLDGRDANATRAKAEDQGDGLLNACSAGSSVAQRGDRNRNEEFSKEIFKLAHQVRRIKSVIDLVESQPAAANSSGRDRLRGWW
jgi:hypothetical protein